MQPGYHVAFIRPAGYAHAEGLREVAETVEHGLRRLGVPVTSAVNGLTASATNIVIGGHLLPRAQLDRLPGGSILYNFEQICAGSMASADYVAALRARPCWDYSLKNLAALERANPAGDCRHVPLGYVPELTRIPAVARQDIDVLFYGSVNERRKRILDDLRDAGARVHAVFGVYGAARDALIARSKLVLNLHFYPTNIFEVVRVSYLLANRKAVVAESSDTTEIDADLREGIEAATYDDLVAACMALLEDDDRRRALEARGQRTIAARDETLILARALDVPPPLAESDPAVDRSGATSLR